MAAWLCHGLRAPRCGGVDSCCVFAVDPAIERVIALAFAFASMWQVSALRARALAMCHGTQPLAPDGWSADYDCARFGWITGVWCSVTCGALMFACWLLGHGASGVAAMAIATAIGVAERYMVRPDQRWLAVSIASLAFLAAITW